MIQTDLDKIPHPQDDPINRECHDLCMALFKKFKAQEITLQELLKENAYIALRYGFNELVPHQYPQRIPEMIEYDNLTFQEKSAIKPEFWRQPQVEKYLETCQKVKWWNKHTKEWLEELQGYIPQEDYLNQCKIKDRIQEFSDNPIVDKIIDTFEAKEN